MTFVDVSGYCNTCPFWKIKKCGFKLIGRSTIILYIYWL